MVSSSAHEESDDWAAEGFEPEGFEREGFEPEGFEPGGIGDVAAQPPMLHDGIPITGYHRGEPIPDLNALPRDRRREVLRPLSYWPRTHATAGPEEHARLTEAAKLFAMRPTTLARILTVRGVNRALYEERRDR